MRAKDGPICNACQSDNVAFVARLSWNGYETKNQGKNDETDEGASETSFRDLSRKNWLPQVSALPFFSKIGYEEAGREEDERDEEKVRIYYVSHDNRLKGVNRYEYYDSLNCIPRGLSIEVHGGTAERESLPSVYNAPSRHYGNTKETVNGDQIRPESIEVGKPSRHQAEGSAKDYNKDNRRRWPKAKMALDRIIILAGSLLLAFLVAQYIGGQASQAGFSPQTIFAFIIISFVVVTVFAVIVTSRDTVELSF